MDTTRPEEPTSRRRAALATAVGHSATVAITVLQAFVLLPLSLSILGAPVLGAWLAASELLIWIQLCDLGVPQLLTQKVGSAIGRGDLALAIRWSATGLLLLASAACVLTAAGVAAAPMVATWVGVPTDAQAEFIECFRVAGFASGTILLFNGVLGLSRGTQRPALVQTAQVVGVASGLVSSVYLLLAGWGLWALATGLVVRAVVSIAGGLAFLWTLPEPAAWLFRPSRPTMAEYRKLGPAMAAGNFGSVLAQNAELLIVASLLGPGAAAVYGLTRRVIDGLKNLLDAFIFAIPGGIAHLITAPDRSRARAVIRDALWLRIGAACLVAAVAVPVNQAFVSLLFGESAYGGLGLTIAFAFQLIVGGQAMLLNVLLRAVGQIRQGNWLLFGESLVRVVALPIGLSAVGLEGAPWSGVVVGLWAVGINRMWLTGALPAGGAAVERLPIASVLVPFGLLLCGILAGLLWPPTSWAGVVVMASILLVAGTVSLWAAKPSRFGLLRG